MTETERLCALLRYDPESGNLFWKANGLKAGGYKATLRGYTGVMVGQKRFYVHRVAFLLMTGRWPVGIDHKNGDTADNRWTNLREATMAQNLQNIGKQAHNRSGFIGASFDKSRGKWDARIKVNQRVHHLGRFDTPEAAHAAYLNAKKRLHLFNPTPREG